jgi:hypothetical protein
MHNSSDATVLLQTELSESQAERLQKRFAEIGLRVAYQEEQHGPVLIVKIGCKAHQEKAVRGVLNDIGAAALPESPDTD